MSKAIHLVAMSDDFGHCEAANEGIVRAFTDGLLTDTNLQANCTGFREACKLTRAHGIPVGLHSTFTCDWDLVRWKPLTAMRSMVAADGHFRNSVAEAWADADLDEAYAELVAQHAAVEAEGLAMTHVGEHMGVDAGGRAARTMARLAVEKRLPHKGQWRDYAGRGMPRYRFDSTFSSTSWRGDLTARKERLRTTLAGLGPGHHMWVTHAAVDHPSLDKLCSPDWHAVEYARARRAMDFSLLTDPEVRDWVAARGIRMVPLASCPVDWGGSE